MELFEAGIRCPLAEKAAIGPAEKRERERKDKVLRVMKPKIFGFGTRGMCVGFYGAKCL